MAEALNPKEIAMAAAQGVAIALSARTAKTGGGKDELYKPPRLICGIPPVLYAIDFAPDGQGGFTPGGIQPQKE
jgi:hypothetical protein